MTDTFNAAVRPAARAAIGGTIAQIDKTQQGGGRKDKRRKRKSVYRRVVSKSSKLMTYNF